MLIRSINKLIISNSTTVYLGCLFDFHLCFTIMLFILLFSVVLQGAQINEAACDLAREVANEGDALVAGGVSQTPSYLSCKSETDVKAIFKKQLDVFIKKDVDFLIAEVEILNVFLFFFFSTF